MNTKQKLVIIVGPTASGKTALAIELAKGFSGEVISADSRQVYRGLDIGTEKVSQEEMDGVPHHLIDIVDLETVYTAADFKRDAETAIRDISGRGNLPIIAGGTFFYIDALIGAAPLPEVPPDPELREKLEALPVESLFRALERLDPERASTIDRHNKRRVVRALEIVQTLGTVPPSLKGSPRIHEQYDILWLGIEVPKSELRARIRKRAERALERGLIPEVEQLLARRVSRERLAEIGHEYPPVLEYVDGNLSMAELLKKIEEKNWQYAKRQLTWLKRVPHVHWIGTGDTATGAQLVQAFIH